METGQSSLELGGVASGPKFGRRFLEKHAGQIMQKPDYAIVELVANCWDAGASSIKVSWPQSDSDSLCIEDNGVGMTETELLKRWEHYNYDRRIEQGVEVAVSNSNGRKRKCFGKNGIGRHAAFCFADNYYVETSSRESPFLIKALVTLSSAEVAKAPFKVDVIERKSTSWYGTKIHCTPARNAKRYNAKEILELIGSKFISDPELEIFVNNKAVTFEEIESLTEEIFCQEIDEGGTIRILRVDTKKTGRTSKQSGVSWWAYSRLVGSPSWKDYNHSIADERRTHAKKLSYIVQADFLSDEDQIKEDWSGFKDSELVSTTKNTAHLAIKNDIHDLTKGERFNKARKAISKNKSNILNLPRISQEQVASFANSVVEKCPRLGQEDVNQLVRILVNLEKSRAGFELLGRLASCSIEDLDDLNEILSMWSVSDAKEVLDELYKRLRLIHELENLIELKSADELHQLHPLFMRGLWIFGPKFESKEYSSNQSLLTVIKKFFDKNYEGCELINVNKRPDFVVIPQGIEKDELGNDEIRHPASVGIRSMDSYDHENEVNGTESILIVELKRGGSTIRDKEKEQAKKYAKALIRSGKVDESTEIVCYVLGSSVEPLDRKVLKDGDNILVHPRDYRTVLRQAHARTFKLYEKMKDLTAEDNLNIDEGARDLLEDYIGDSAQDSLLPGYGA